VSGSTVTPCSPNLLASQASPMRTTQNPCSKTVSSILAFFIENAADPPKVDHHCFTGRPPNTGRGRTVIGDRVRSLSRSWMRASTNSFAGTYIRCVKRNGRFQLPALMAFQYKGQLHLDPRDAICAGTRRRPLSSFDPGDIRSPAHDLGRALHRLGRQPTCNDELAPAAIAWFTSDEIA